MKVLIASLQVSQSGSKGHLHPALELAIEFSRRGHEVTLLPLPSPFGPQDRAQVSGTGIGFLDPPPLPAGILKTTQELGALAGSRETLHEAYRSFLIEPLPAQYPAILRMLEELKPTVVVSDTLVYGPALAARSLGIPDVGFCAGLKLLAPARLTTTYQDTHLKLKPDYDAFLGRHAPTAEIRNLELLSPFAQFVFTLPELVPPTWEPPPRTVVAGPLPVSSQREDAAPEVPMDHDFAVLCFGSVLDPVNYPEILAAAIDATADQGLNLWVSSRKLADSTDLPRHVRARSYLNLPALIRAARVLLHHGGANSFSEALTLGVPQILIPLTNDQPIQAELLTQAQAGIALEPIQVNRASLNQALGTLLNREHPIHGNIARLAELFQNANGATRAAQIMEDMAP